MTAFILGRIIFGAYFVYAGFNHFQNEAGLTGYAKSKGIPSPRIAILLTGAMLIVGGLGFIFDTHIALSGLLILIFLIPTTFVMHAFWKEKDGMARMNDRIQFTKNLALIGATLMML